MNLVDALCDMATPYETRIGTANLTQTSTRDQLFKAYGISGLGRNDRFVVALIFERDGDLLTARDMSEKSGWVKVPSAHWSDVAKHTKTRGKRHGEKTESMLAIANQVATQFQLGVTLTEVQPIGVAEEYINGRIYVLALRVVSFEGELTGTDAAYVRHLDCRTILNCALLDIFETARTQGVAVPQVEGVGEFEFDDFD